MSAAGLEGNRKSSGNRQDGDAEDGIDGAEFEGMQKPTFFSEISMCELAFGVGAVKLNSLCLGMVLNIPTLTLHKLMITIVPMGLLHENTTEQERVNVCKVILDHWLARTKDMSRKKRFKQLYDAFLALKEKTIANEIKAKYEADEPLRLEMFYKLDVSRLGPYVPPPEPVDDDDDGDFDGEGGQEEGVEEEEDDDMVDGDEY